MFPETFHVILVATVETVQLEAKFAASARRSIHLELWKQVLGSLALVIYEPPKINSRNLKFTALKNEKRTIESESDLQFGFQPLNFQGCFLGVALLGVISMFIFFFVSYIGIWSLGGAWLGMMLVPFPDHPTSHENPQNPKSQPAPEPFQMGAWGLIKGKPLIETREVWL